MKLATTVMVISLSVVSLAGCKSKSSSVCPDFVNKNVANATELAKAMVAAMPGGAAHAQDMEKKITENAKKHRPEMLKACAEMLKKDPSTEKIMKCVIGAKDLKATQACDPDHKLAAMNAPK
jgi:ATP-dependent protease HslVU (ClpYQ) peptidase subunit